MRYNPTLKLCVDSTAVGDIFDNIQGFSLTDGIPDDADISPYISKIVLDINSPTGAFVFAFIIGGIFVVFIAILDSLKPPNFPPGPRWLPFGGDSSGLCSKSLTLTATSELASRFGAVVGLRQSDSLRTPLIITLDLESASALDAASQDGLLSDTPHDDFHDLTGIPRSLKDEINDIITSQKMQEILAQASFECTSDFYRSVECVPKSAYSSTISVTLIAALFNVITGRRIQPTSPHLVKLHKILVESSNFQYFCDDHQWNDKADPTTCALRTAQIVMALSDIEESEEWGRLEGPRPHILGLLRQSVKFSFSERCAITADVLVKSNIAYHGIIMRQTLNELMNSDNLGNQKRFQKEKYVDPSHAATSNEILASHNSYHALLLENSRSQPWLQIGPRRKVLKSFLLNGFVVPENSHVQSILNRADGHSILVKKNCCSMFKKICKMSVIVRKTTFTKNCDSCRIYVNMLNRVMCFIKKAVKCMD